LINLINAHSKHIPLEDKSIHCCICSPPYWNLRDYQTAKWIGGSGECDHKVGRFEYPVSDKQNSNSGSAGHQARGKCPKCGAVRVDNQIGLERTPEEFVANMVAVFREVWRVLRDDGVVWLNLGDSYNSGSGGYDDKYQGGFVGREDIKGKVLRNSGRTDKSIKPKDLCMIPARVALALQADGWYLRSDIIWNKLNPMPESVTDRPTKSHEYIFLLSKKAKYYYDADAIKEPQSEVSIRRAFSTNDVLGRKDADENVYAISGKSQDKTYEKMRASINAGIEQKRNKRSVWSIATQPYKDAHFATYPPALVKPCVLAGTSERGACPKCGAPWERVVEIVNKGYAKHDGSGRAVAMGHTPTGPTSRGSIVPDNTQTLGWQPTCTCTAGNPVPCTVLDPFNGAGTTGLVALQYGRRYVGIDISAEYLNMSKRRLDAASRQTVMRL
jgi:DNA modification methylase